MLFLRVDYLSFFEHESHGFDSKDKKALGEKGLTKTEKTSVKD